MAVREYIGARYVPIFGREGDDTTQWSIEKEYEPLTVVLHGGNSYTSRQHVPIGIDITNGTYWAETGNYNAQIEQYRAEVRQFDNRMTNVENATAQLESGLATEVSNRTAAIDSATAQLESELATEVSNRTAAIDSATTQLTNAIENEETAREMAVSSLRSQYENSIKTYDLSNCTNVNAEANITDTDSIFIIYNTMTRELFITGVLRATTEFTRGTNVVLFTLPNEIPRPNPRIFIFGATRNFAGPLNNEDSKSYIGSITIDADGNVIENNMAALQDSGTVKNIMFVQNAIPLSNVTNTPA